MTEETGPTRVQGRKSRTKLVYKLDEVSRLTGVDLGHAGDLGGGVPLPRAPG
ncbi:MAG: hypothetical protein MZV70_29475 [Desulfobacterales bacterium]|nr:hypothetical protein [Desulfobacterales bacterium]